MDRARNLGGSALSGVGRLFEGAFGTDTAYAAEGRPNVGGGGLGGEGVGGSGSSGSDGLDAGGPQTGGSGPVLKGQQGVSLSEAFWTNRGYMLKGREITFDTDGGRTRVDLVVEDSEGNYTIVEAKNGPSARLSKNQKAAFPYLRSAGGVPRGANAAAAGFENGVGIGPVPVMVQWWYG